MKNFSVTMGLVLIAFLYMIPQTAFAAVGYSVTTSLTDPTCDTGFGGYLDLESYGLFPNPGISGDTVTWNAFSSQSPINFFGSTYSDGIFFTDDGFAFLAGTQGSEPWTPQSLPDAADPNALIAPLWNDFEIVYDGTPGARKGVTLATASMGGEPIISIIEYDDVQLYGTTDIIGDFEVIINREEEAKDIVFAYNNLNQALLSNVFTVGIEDGTGNRAYTVINNAAASGVLSNGLMVCFDAIDIYSIGGTVSGLVPGSSLVLQNNMSDDLLITAEGNFTFPVSLEDGSDYVVTVKTQPTIPTQLCTVTNGTGTLAGADVTNVAVNCVTNFPWTMFLPAINKNEQH